MKTRTLVNFKKYLFLFLFLFILFLLAFYYQEGVKNLTFKIFSPFQSFFWQKLHFLSSLSENVLNLKNLSKENQELKKENLELTAEIEKLKEAKKECDFFKNDFETETQNFQYAIARVVGRTNDGDTLLIDKGKNEEVFESEVVLGQGKVLLGKIQKVYQNFSKLKLISSNDFKVLVRKEGSEKNLLLEGKGNLNLLLNFIPKEFDLKAGEKIFTSPSQTDFPPSVLIGEIKEVIKKETLPYQQAKIKPYFFNFQFVYLIKNFKPWAEK